MAVTIRVRKKGKKFDSLKKSIRRIHKESVDVGYFQEQGVHNSGFTFPVLMAIHEFGIGYTPRPVFTIAAVQIKSQARFISLAGKNWAKSLTKSSKGSDIALLDNIGAGVQSKIHSLFGNPAALVVTGNQTPLIKTSELLGNLSRKNSIDKKIRR